MRLAPLTTEAVPWSEYLCFIVEEILPGTEKVVQDNLARKCSSRPLLSPGTKA